MIAVLTRGHVGLRCLIVAVLVIGSGWVSVAPAVAADGTRITGTVRDVVGAVVPGVQVTAYSSTTDTSPDHTTYTANDGSYVLDVPAGTWYLRFTKTFFRPRWYDGQQTQANARGVTVALGATVTAINVSLFDLRPTGGLDFFPSKVPLVIATDQAYGESVRIDSLPDVNGCACITFADGSTASTINGKTIYKITFRKLRAIDPLSIVGDAPSYKLTASDPSGSKGDVVIGGTNVAGGAMTTEVYGTLDSISITPLCFVNWAFLAGVGDVLTFGINATAYCAKFTAYAVRAFDDAPSPNPYNNPLFLPEATFTLVSR